MRTRIAGIFRKVWVWALAAGLLAGLAWVSLKLSTHYLLEDTAQRAETTLRMTIAGLKGALGQYRSLPQLIADNPDVRTLLASPNPHQADHVNLELRRINNAVQASDTYVMNLDGLTVASSNFEKATSFVGKNFSYRPYFTDALKGRLSRYFALGTTSLKRGYYYAAPVHIDEKIFGVVTVKVNVDQFETPWHSRDHVVLVTDEHGIVFMSSQKDLLYKSLKPLSDAQTESIRRSRKYHHASFSPLPLTRKGKAAGAERVSLPGADEPVEYLLQSRPMPEEGWEVKILTRTASAHNQALIISASAFLVLLSTMLAIAYLVQRRQQLLERMRSQAKSRDELERRVRSRTAELDEANVRLREEVNERKATEHELRKTQADLVQAGKLAALGQMSAALSHELNQPLGAAKSYADNAAAFIDRGRVGEARENITRIGMLVERMGAISRHLRNFARKPNEQLSIVPVATTINDALEILDRRIKALGVEVEVSLPHEELWVVGGQVRLQQVLVNLINNAIDAMEASPHPRVRIAATSDEGGISLTVRDNGPGISAELEEKIFDPFFTTKGIGAGLGLGLSISYNIIRDFGGNLKAVNHREGGAMFILTLKSAADEPQEAAE